MACFDDKAPDFSEKSILFVSISFQMKMVEIGLNQIDTEIDIKNWYWDFHSNCLKCLKISGYIWISIKTYEKNCKIISNCIQLFMKNYWHLEKK